MLKGFSSTRIVLRMNFCGSPNENRKYDVITVCNLIPTKRVQDIILAIHLLKQEAKVVNLCIVGDGQDRLMLENLAREKDVLI